MTGVPHRSTSLRRVVVAGLVLVGSVSAAPVFASGGDSAPRARLDAEVSCDGTVEWQADASGDDEKGSNPDIRVMRSVDGGAPEEVGQGSFSKANDHEFSGSFEWPDGADKVLLTVVPQGTWGNGSTSKQGETVELELPDDCDGHPHVGDDVECVDSAPGVGEGTVVLTLSNPAGPFGRTARFSVHEPDGGERRSSHEVRSGDTESVEFHHLSDGHHEVKIDIDGESEDHEFEVDCNRPVTSVEQSEECVDGFGEVTLLLSNTGGDSAEFRVEHPLTHEVETLVIEAGGSATRRFAGLPDGEWTIPVQAGDHDLSQSVEIDCAMADDHGDDECEDHDDDAPDDGDDDGTSTSVEDSSPDSSVEDSSPESSIEDSSPESSVEGSSPDSSVEDSFPESSVHHSSPSVSVESWSSKPSTSVESSSPESSVEDSSPDSSVEDSSPDSSVDDSTPDGRDDDDEADDDDDDCEEEGRPEVTFTKSCVDQDGQVSITLSVVGGDDSIKFVVAGAIHKVKPGTTKVVVIGGLTDGTHTIPITADGKDKSITVTIACDLPPAVKVTQECSAFDGVIEVLLDNPGDDLPATFSVNGTETVVAPGASTRIRIEGLADGSHTLKLTINGVAQPDVVVTFDCDPVFEVVARCNTVSSAGAVQVHWFTVTNTESVDVTVTWPDGSLLVPAGESRTIGSTSATLSIEYAGVTIASAEASAATCSKDVTVSKTVIGTPPAGEVYTVTIWRRVGTEWDTITSFDVAPGSPVTVELPSTLDPAGIEYRIEETAKGSASTSSVSPGTITLTGDQGATVSVAVTNGYAGVSVSKSADVGSVTPGSTVEYTLAPTNTGGLTLDPVVVFDRLPEAMSMVSATVAGDAGTCSLAESSRPQLVKCVMSAALAAGDTGPAITLVGRVDAGATPSATLVNRAKAVGVFGSGTVPDEPDGSTPSCSTIASGTVCALSPAVEVVVETPPPPTTTTPTTVPATTVPPTDPPVTTVPPTDPPVTTVPPTAPPTTDPPVTTVPPTVPPTDPPVTTVPPTTVPPTVPPTDPPVTTAPPAIDPPTTTTVPPTVPPTDPPVTTTPPSTDPPAPTTAGPTTIAPTTAPPTTATETTTVVSQEPPAPPTTPAPSTTTKEQSGGLPHTGGAPMPGLLVGLGSICLGLAMVLTRRRTAPR